VPLVAAVLNAANLGTLGTSGCSPDEMRDTTARLRDVTTAPFGRRKLAHADEETDARLVREIKQALPQLTVIRGRHTTHGNVARLLVGAPSLGSFVGTGDPRGVIFAFAARCLSVPYGDWSFRPAHLAGCALASGS
jgi:NAD(P)H-dependent flavin oxidoreductase YrpB (nitropropane dioxygenase family)